MGADPGRGTVLSAGQAPQAVRGEPYGADERTARRVPCATDALIDTIEQLNETGGGRLALTRKCIYVLDGAWEGGSGLPTITTSITIYGRGATVMRHATAEAFGVFEVAAGGDLQLHQLTVSGGKSADAPGLNGGGGVLVQQGGQVGLDRVMLTKNTVADTSKQNGGALYNLGVSVIENSVLTQNVAYDGGAVFNASGAELVVRKSNLTQNTATNTGGALHQGAQAVIKDSLFSDNRSEGESGGAIYNVNTDLQVFRTTFLRNTAADDGGALINKGSGTLTMKGVKISNNIAKVYGGGLYVEGNALIEDTYIRGNVATDARGGAIYINEAGTVVVRRTVITRNQAGETAGGVQIEDGSVTLAGTRITKNLSGIQPGGVLSLVPITVTGKTIIKGNLPTNCAGGIEPIPGCTD
ncbi:right-handed parallel beta-helix repeat-containing protein [Streptomyces marianii]|uniref:right-handed parallel beta-helix repeat-containing protein n=1 Tax=Streptomyces marianii TaxID=1817406 RepID=UPI00148728A4|nr:right-handed parallel beta-helix repeat-containing protein [Streptomyces marianii]